MYRSYRIFLKTISLDERLGLEHDDLANVVHCITLCITLGISLYQINSVKAIDHFGNKTLPGAFTGMDIHADTHL